MNDPKFLTHKGELQDSAIEMLKQKMDIIKYFQFSLDETEEFLQVQFDFPDYNDVEIKMDTLRNGDPKYASETAKKKLVKESLFSMMVWVGHVLGTQLQGKSVQQIGINVHQSWFDPATGKPASGIIASVMGGIDHLASLNIENVKHPRYFILGGQHPASKKSSSRTEIHLEDDIVLSRCRHSEMKHLRMSSSYLYDVTILQCKLSQGLNKLDGTSSAL